MAFPKTLDELKPAGYTFTGEGRCKGCGEEIEWWKTPSGKNLPLNPMERGISEAVAHWATCPDAARFRKGKA